MRTGHKPLGPIQYPSIGASLANQLGGGKPSGLPGYISVGPYRAFNQDAFGPGFLGPQFSPLIVGAADVPGATVNDADGYPQLRVKDLEPGENLAASRLQDRLALWKNLGSEFLAAHQTGRRQYAPYGLRKRGRVDEERRCLGLRPDPRAGQGPRSLRQFGRSARAACWPGV